MDKLRIVQSQMGKKELKLKSDRITRWNSTPNMFERLVELKEPLSAALAALPKSPQSLTNAQWEILTDCTLLLKPFELMTVEISAEKYPTLSKIIPLVRGITHSLKLKNITSRTGENFKRILLNGINTRLGNMEKIKLWQHQLF